MEAEKTTEALKTRERKKKPSEMEGKIWCVIKGKGVWRGQWQRKTLRGVQD